MLDFIILVVSFVFTLLLCKIISYVTSTVLWKLPIIGHLHCVGNAPHKKFTEWSRQYGSVYHLQLGLWPTVVVNGYEAVRHALFKHKNDFAGRPKFESFKHYAGGTSISFRNYGSDYKEHRKVAMNIIKELIIDHDFQIDKVIADASQNLINSLVKECAVDPSKPVHTAVGTILYALCFGKHQKLHQDKEFYQMFLSMNPNTELFGGGHQADLLPHCMRNKKYYDGLAHMTRQLKLNDQKINQCMMRFKQGIDDTSFFDKVINNKNQKFLLNTSMELISAGSETSSAVLLWLIMYMACYQDIQAKVNEEIKYCGNSFDNLPFTQACICEVMRLNTIVPLALPHSAIRDVKFLGHTIRKNTYVIINLWSVCRDASLWKNPNSFQPERFLKTRNGIDIFDRAQAEKVYAFGAGHRRCIGEALGKKQVLQLFAHMMKACKVEKSSQHVELEPQFGDVLKPQPYKVHFKLRNH